MKPSVKGRWLKALRHGGYDQGAGYLKQRDSAGNEKHCCLGVLCEVYSKEHPDYVFEEGPRGVHRDLKIESFLGAVNSLPKPVMDWAGFDNILGPHIDMGNEGLPLNLAYLNDHSWTFKQIAELIEKKL